MMKVVHWFGLLFICAAAPANAHLSLTGTSPRAAFSSTRLIDINQSQSLEAVSTADLIGLPSYKLAGVYFITRGNGQNFTTEAKDNDFTNPTVDNCKRYGFAITSCSSGLFNRACPYNDKIYDKCCEAAYIYDASNCPSPRKLSSESCGGKHRCYCEAAQYPFTSCNAPQIKGSACTDDNGTRYASCVCPAPVSTPYGCETYYSAPCESICKKAYADNCHNRTAVQTPYGCEKYFTDCSSKCEKAYTDNCRNRTAVSTPYGCRQTYGDCQSKCEIAYPDNCRNRNTVIGSCPANATCSYFSDCSSKIQSWSCKSGYEKSGNNCIISPSIGFYIFGDGTASGNLTANKTPAAIVFDTVNRLAVAIKDVNSNGTGVNTNGAPMYWSSGYCDTPGLTNCTNNNTVTTSCGVDGRANTNAILACQCNGVTYAANGTNNYEPANCNSSFCKRNKWFLPSLRDLQNLYSAKSPVNNSLTLASRYGAQTLSNDVYWSSTEYSNTEIWRMRMSDSHRAHYGRFYNAFVRPIVKY